MATTFVDPGPAHYAVKGGTAQAVPYPLWLDDPDPGLWGVVSEPNGLMGFSDGGMPGAVLAATEYSVMLDDSWCTLEIYTCAEVGGQEWAMNVRMSGGVAYLLESQSAVFQISARTTYQPNAFNSYNQTVIWHTLNLPFPEPMLTYLEAATAADPDFQAAIAIATADPEEAWLLDYELGRIMDAAPIEVPDFGGLRYTRRSDGIYLGAGSINEMVFSAEDFAAFAPKANSLGLWGGRGYKQHGFDVSYFTPEELYIGHYEFADVPAEAFWTGHVLTFER